MEVIGTGDGDGEVKLLGAEVMRDRRRSAGNKDRIAGGGQKGGDYSDGELKRYAQMTIDERIKFCKEKKEKINDVDIDKCVCEAVTRWIRLCYNKPMKGSVVLGNLRVVAVEKLFEEMKKDGRIKCQN